MTKPKNRHRTHVQFGIRGLVLATMLVAVFLGGRLSLKSKVDGLNHEVQVLRQQQDQQKWPTSFSASKVIFLPANQIEVPTFVNRSLYTSNSFSSVQNKGRQTSRVPMHIELGMELDRIETRSKLRNQLGSE